MMEVLHTAWRVVTNRLVGMRSPEDAFIKIIAAYAAAGRRYHTVDHLAHMFAILEPYRPETDWPPLALAVFYHDYVYDSRRADNEEQSADAAVQALSGAGHALIARVRELILFTKSHHAPDDDKDAWLFLDADLSILASDRYDEYRRHVREEYAWVPERDFLTGRRAVLSTFLEREKIFRRLTDFENRARANLAAEIAQIDERLRQLLRQFFVDEPSASG